jgi:hypothetical protein
MAMDRRVHEVDNQEYLGVLKQLITEEGKEVSLRISGGSMSPFLVHQRDEVLLAPIRRELKKGDIVFFQRENNDYVLHRIKKITKDGYYLIGDGQIEIEGPIRRERIFSIVTLVQRKGKKIAPGSFWWWFFEKIWLNIIPFRKKIQRMYPSK